MSTGGEKQRGTIAGGQAALDAEASESAPAGGTYVRVGTTADIGAGTAKQVETSGPTLAVFKISGAIYAIDDRCPHEGCPLSEGDLEGTILTCSCHGSQFDVTTGALVRGPAATGVRAHAVRVSGVDIDVEL